MKKLQEIYKPNSQNKDLDSKGYPFAWNFNPSVQSSSKVFYSIGCSWIHQSGFHRVFSAKPDILLINRAFGGQGNSLMIDTLMRDLSLVEDATFIVSFSEIGRNLRDFSYCNPRGYTSAHDYCKDILISQYERVTEILKGKKYFITTSFVPNPFNDNKRLIDFCDGGTQPNNSYIISPNVFEYMKDRCKIFNFNFSEDLSKTLEYLKWIESHNFVDNTIHPFGLKPYEDFVDYIMAKV